MSSALPCPAEEITVTAEEKDTETEEDQLFPDPMEEEQESELIGKYLLDITLKHGEEEIEPTGPVKVTFSGLRWKAVIRRSIILTRKNRKSPIWKWIGKKMVI